MISFTRQRHRQANAHRGKGFCLLLLGLLASGCGGSHGEITGKVYYKGQPVTSPGAVVTFIDTNGGVFSSSVASDGGYVIADVPVGQVKVAVLVLPPRKTDRIQQTEQEAIRSGKLNIPPEERQKMVSISPPRGLAIPLPPTYADPEKSGLMHVVTGGKQTFDIQLR